MAQGKGLKRGVSGSAAQLATAKRGSNVAHQQQRSRGHTKRGEVGVWK